MKFRFVLKDGSVILGTEVDYFANNIRVIDTHKPNDDSELEDCTFSIYMISPDSIVYSSCEHISFDEYLDYLDSCEPLEEENKQSCNCETCGDCDCQDCDEASTGSYEVKDTSEDNNMYI